MIALEPTKHETMVVADGVILTIRELHDMNIPQLNALWQDARRRFCKEEESAYAMRLLELSFGLAALAVHAAKLQSAVESVDYARTFWQSVSVN